LKVSANRRPNNPFAHVQPLPNRTLLAWVDGHGRPHQAAANRKATSIDFHLAGIARQGAKYPNRRNYEGFYWCSQTKSHVWYESMAEYTALMWMDYSYDVAAVASQPMCIVFPDGHRHYPDYFVVLGTGDQLVVDVRPLALVDDKAS
jgi:hypothetical protein